MGDWRLVLNTAPALAALTVAEVKAHSRIDFSDDDDLLADLIAAATAHLDGAVGWLGRCLVEQTWDLKLDCFPLSGRRIDIPLAPLISVGSISYIDENGATQTWASSNYTAFGVGAHMGGGVVEAYEKSYPATRNVPEAVTVTFTAGYENDDSGSPSVNTVPAAIKRALLIMVADLYEQRETFADGATSAVPVAAPARALLAPYRNRSMF